MGIHNVYAQCIQKVPDIGDIYIYVYRLYSVFAYVCNGTCCGNILPFCMEYLDDLSTSKDLLPGSILPRRPCAWLAPCHRTTRLTSTGRREASAARCGRSCLNNFGLRMKVQTTPPPQEKSKKWSSFGIGKSISV